MLATVGHATFSANADNGITMIIPSIKSVITERKLHQDLQNEAFLVCQSRPVCISFLLLPALPLTADTLHCPTHWQVLGSTP